MPLVSKDPHINACVAKLNATPVGLSLWLTEVQLYSPILKQTKHSQALYVGLPKKLKGQMKVSIYGYSDGAQPKLNGFNEGLGLAALIGHKVDLIVRLKGARNYQNPQHFDYLRWTQINRQVASGYVKKWLGTGLACSSVSWPKVSLEKLRQRLWQRLKHIGKIHATAPISVGL